MDKDQFSFVLCEVNTDESGTETCAGAGEAATSRDGSAKFDTLVYDSVGTYIYHIREVVGRDPDTRYDLTVITATVEVVDNGEGALQATVTYSDANNGIDQETGLPLIVNHMTVSTLMPKTGETWWVIVSAALVLSLLLACAYAAARRVWRM